MHIGLRCGVLSKQEEATHFARLVKKDLSSFSPTHASIHRTVHNSKRTIYYRLNRLLFNPNHLQPLHVAALHSYGSAIQSLLL